MIYIASPFTHKDSAVEALRFAQVSRYAYKLLLSNIPAFSPIVYGYHFHSSYSHPGDHETWLAFNTAMLKICSRVHVYCLPGWRESKGIKAEIAQAEALNIPVSFVTPVL